MFFQLQSLNTLQKQMLSLCYLLQSMPLSLLVICFLLQLRILFDVWQICLSDRLCNQYMFFCLNIQEYRHTT